MKPSNRTGRNVDTAALLFVLCLAAALSGCSLSKPTATTSGPAVPVIAVIPAGVTVDGVSVGGQTPDAAKAKLKAAVTSRLDSVKFRFHDPSAGGTFHYSAADFGGYFDIPGALKTAMGSAGGANVPLALHVNQNLVSLHLSRIADEWRVPVQEPKVKFTDDGRQVLPGHEGRTLNIASSLSNIMANLPTLSKPVVVDDLPFNVAQPIVDPHRVLGLADTLESFTTTFNPSNGTRTNNLLLAVKNINGTVVGPGEVFSYNDSVGPRTTQTGFQDAIIYVDNRMKKDVGGGICQASSTLYNCVLLANMPIVERHAHSLPVHYVPAGRDATVAWGGDDFRFRNNTAKPIVIRASATSGGTLTESLIGDHGAVPHPNEQVAIDVTPQRPYEDGYAVNAFRVVKEGGVLIAREPLGISVYHKLVGGVPH